LDTSFMGDFASFEKGTKSRINILHCLLALQVIHEALEDNTESIGYITPYRAQAELMEGIVNDFFPQAYMNKQITVATVHRFQGSERDIIIFDSVESEPFLKPGMLLIGKDSERLLNVAITRSKGKFIHIANRNYLKNKVQKGKTVHQLINHQEENNTVITSANIGNWIKQNNPKLFWTHAKKLDILKKDMLRANGDIVFALPDNKNITNKWKELLPNTNPVKQSALSFPIIIIKNKIVWLGYPLEAMNGTKPPSIGLRVHSPFLAEYFLKMINS